MEPVRVLIVCATSLATSTMAEAKLKDEFNRRGIQVKIEKGRISDMDPLIRQTHPDIVVATAVVKRDVGVPLFDGVPLLSGIGKEQLFEEIFSCVEKMRDESEEHD